AAGEMRCEIIVSPLDAPLCVLAPRETLQRLLCLLMRQLSSRSGRARLIRMTVLEEETELLSIHMQALDEEMPGQLRLIDEDHGLANSTRQLLDGLIEHAGAELEEIHDGSALSYRL